MFPFASSSVDVCNQEVERGHYSQALATFSVMVCSSSSSSLYFAASAMGFVPTLRAESCGSGFRSSSEGSSQFFVVGAIVVLLLLLLWWWRYIYCGRYVRFAAARGGWSHVPSVDRSCAWEVVWM